MSNGITLYNAQNMTCVTPPANRTLSMGRFQVTLDPSCTDFVHANPDVSVQVIVEGVQLPKTKLGAVPYALEAQRAMEASPNGTLQSRLQALEADRVVYAFFSLSAADTVTIHSQSGNWISSATASGKAITFAIAPGIFSAPPACTFSGSNNPSGGNTVGEFIGPHTNTTLTFGFGDSGSILTLSNGASIICVGPK